MQNPNYNLNEVCLVPIPWKALDEIELDPEVDHIQCLVRRGRIILKPIEGPQNMVCHGQCYRCEGRFHCPKLQESLCE